MSNSNRYPLTAYQRDIWTVAEMYSGQPAYLCCAAWHLTIAVDEAELMAAVERTLIRNDGVRMRYGVVDGIPYQELSPERQPPVQLIDVTGGDDPEGEAHRRIRALTGSAIDLNGPEPFRLTIIRAAAQSYYLVTTSHHVTVDATGLRILGAQIMTDYTVTTKTGTPPELPSASFVECLAIEGAYRASEQYRIDRDAVVPRLRSVTPTLFGHRHDTDGVGSATARTFTLDRALVNRIRAAGISLYPYFLAMLGIYLSRVLRAEEITIGIPFGNRNNSVENAAVGNFANTLPVFLDMGTYPTVAELVGAVKADVRQLKQHQRYPLGDLVGELRRVGNPARQLFDVTVAYTRSPAIQYQLRDPRPQAFDRLTTPSATSSTTASAANPHTATHQHPRNPPTRTSLHSTLSSACGCVRLATALARRQAEVLWEITRWQASRRIEPAVTPQLTPSATSTKGIDERSGSSSAVAHFTHPQQSFGNLPQEGCALLISNPQSWVKRKLDKRPRHFSTTEQRTSTSLSQYHGHHQGLSPTLPRGWIPLPNPANHVF
ncbi:condensation domain-containing protein [Nocardia sp. NPDC101769]|uniref:condensation domain-containing protein n=1 Tax=Nocardia sp. NPDC101769 TaxID=3364333 RepID=UPI0038160C5C